VRCVRRVVLETAIKLHGSVVHTASVLVTNYEDVTYVPCCDATPRIRCERTLSQQSDVRTDRQTGEGASLFWRVDTSVYSPIPAVSCCWSFCAHIRAPYDVLQWSMVHSTSQIIYTGSLCACSADCSFINSFIINIRASKASYMCLHRNTGWFCFVIRFRSWFLDVAPWSRSAKAMALHLLG